MSVSSTSSAASGPPIAPGAHILVRDAVWRVQQVNTTSGGGKAWHVVGVDEIVQDQEAVYLEAYEPEVRVLDPADTALEVDTSPGHRDGLHHDDRAIISIDTLKQNNAFRALLEQARSDVIVIDEAHNVAARGGGVRCGRRWRRSAPIAKLASPCSAHRARTRDGKRRRPARRRAVAVRRP